MNKIIMYAILGGVVAAIIAIIAYSMIIANHWWLNKTITEWITAIGVPIAILFSSYTIYRARKNEKHQVLMDIFKLLDDNAHRNARRRLYNLQEEEIPERRRKILLKMGGKKDDLDRLDAIHTESAEIVKADFNQIGHLIENDAISKNDFLRVYWSEVLKSWEVLGTGIEKNRGDLNDQQYMYGFGELKKYAKVYQQSIKGKISSLKDVYVGPSVASCVGTITAAGRYKIYLTFDLPMNEHTLNSKYIFLEDSTNVKPIPFSMDYDPAKKTLTLEVETESVNFGTESTVVIKGEVEDGGKNQMKEVYKNKIKLA